VLCKATLPAVGHQTQHINKRTYTLCRAQLHLTAALHAPAAAALHARERSVRAKASAEPEAAAASNAADEEDVLAVLYSDAAPTPASNELQQPGQAAAAAEADLLDALYGAEDAAPSSSRAAANAAAAPPAAAAEDLLDELYGAAEKAAAAQSSRGAALVIAAAAADGAAEAAPTAVQGSSEPKQQQQQQQQQPSSPNTSGGSGGGGGSGRVPPTHVVAPDLPADLDVFNNAVLLVDKPLEWTSFDACNAIKGAMKRLGVKKVRGLYLGTAVRILSKAFIISFAVGCAYWILCCWLCCDCMMRLGVKKVRCAACICAVPACIHAVYKHEDA
jgi:hypothetical protein